MTVSDKISDQDQLPQVQHHPGQPAGPQDQPQEVPAESRSR